jgi:pyridoxine kinase
LVYLSEKGEGWVIKTDKLPMNPEPNGAGDLTAVFFLGRYLEIHDAKRSLELMVNSVFSVFEHTLVAQSH